MQVYPTDLTDSQWAKIENLFDNRKRKHQLRAIIIEEMHESLHSMCRKQAGREESPSMGLSQYDSVSYR